MHKVSNEFFFLRKNGEVNKVHVSGRFVIFGTSSYCLMVNHLTINIGIVY
jgi:hypothetical protein